MEIGGPTNIQHVAHVTFDRFNGFLGLPSEFEPDVPKKAPSASATVFGVSTESMQLSYDSRGNCVPVILLLLQSRLYDQGGLQVEGIFRITGENSEEEYVREQLNKGLIPDGIDVHCLAGLIKAWFRELPRGVLDPLPAGQVMQCESDDEFVKVVRLLPQTEASLLNWAINLMADVVQFEHVNKMNSRNLALVFAPNMSKRKSWEKGEPRLLMLIRDVAMKPKKVRRKKRRRRKKKMHAFEEEEQQRKGRRGEEEEEEVEGKGGMRSKSKGRREEEEEEEGGRRRRGGRRWRENWRRKENGKLIPPNMDQSSTRLLNLTVLQRIDPFIEEILITAAHVTFYEFNIEISQWSRKDVEGSLFVVKRNKQQPRFQFIVMNRRNTDNLVEDLLGDFEYEVQGPYLLYRNASQEVNGIWFYNERECEEVARLFDRLISAYSKANQKPNTSSSKSEFGELEAVPTMAAMDGPLEPSLTARDAPNDPAFVNFFSSAMTLGNGSASGPPYQSSATPLQPHQPTIASPAPLQSSSPIMSHFENNPDLISSNNSNVHTDLVTPSSFFAPPRTMTQPHLIPGSSIPTAPPQNFNDASHHQRQHGTPMLQPFPPPTPPPSLAPSYSVPVINRDKVKEALLKLVQENEFIDMVTRALQNAHQQ
ncbi:unnamed protein product [Brassica napus]|uniref:(rape) hypothetical protein n=1 Tax=Brassica napus TaxID=3708 RepID=A0A816PQF5_BRANA|nr:unnamed protein product [Brassica napus]